MGAGVLSIFFVFVVVSNGLGSATMAFYAVAATATTGVMVMGIFIAAGWTMGAVEAITISLLVGLSVDSAVHLCEGYIKCGLTWRKPELQDNAQRAVRARASLAQTGVPLMASTVLSCTIAICLCMTTIQIFSKVAQVVLTCSIIACANAFVFLVAALSGYGPEDLRHAWDWMWIGLRAGLSLIMLGLAIL